MRADASAFLAGKLAKPIRQLDFLPMRPAASALIATKRVSPNNLRPVILSAVSVFNAAR
jgi:hypothetical protein